MPRKTFTSDNYHELVAAFRRVPGNISGASRLAHVAPATARRGWHLGWPERQQKAIKVLLEEEAAEVRRRLEEAAERERKLEERERALRPLVDSQKERLTAIERREEWGRACAASRHNAQAMLVTVGKLLSAVYAKSEYIRGELAKLDLTPQQWLRVTRELVSAGKTVTEALHLTLQTEHLALGQPTDIVGLAPMSMSLEEAQEEIRLAQRAVERAKARKTGSTLDAEFAEIIDRSVDNAGPVYVSKHRDGGQEGDAGPAAPGAAPPPTPGEPAPKPPSGPPRGAQADEIDAPRALTPTPGSGQEIPTRNRPQAIGGWDLVRHELDHDHELDPHSEEGRVGEDIGKDIGEDIDADIGEDIDDAASM